MRKVGIDKSGLWIREAFGILFTHPGTFILMGLVYTLISQLPFLLGFLITLLLGPALIAGMVFAADQSASGRPPRVGQLFQVFQDGERIGSYMALCLPLIALIAFMVVLLIPFAISIGSTLQGSAGGGKLTPDQLAAAMGPYLEQHLGLVLLGLALYIAASFIVSMFTFLAPARILFTREGAFTAMRRCYAACRLNLGAYILLIVFVTLIFIGLMIVFRILVTFLPTMLAAVLVYTPFNAWLALLVFVVYRSMFGEDSASSEASPGSPDTAAPAPHTFEA